MEEILASIRRIIADDDPPKAATLVAPPPLAPKPAPPPPAPPPQVMAPPPPAPKPAPPPVAAKPAPPPPAPPPPEEPDILDLTESMASPEAGFRTIDGQPDVIFTDTPPEPAPEPRPSAMDEARRQFTQSAVERTLLSTNTMAAVDSAFNTLAQTVLVQNNRTLEDLVKEMLRPMLKTWLDDNLPGVVERLVRAEIERVSRGRNS
jgi:cell pole-organizing protein PopZ